MLLLINKEWKLANLKKIMKFYNLVQYLSTNSKSSTKKFVSFPLGCTKAEFSCKMSFPLFYANVFIRKHGVYESCIYSFGSIIQYKEIRKTYYYSKNK